MFGARVERGKGPKDIILEPPIFKVLKGRLTKGD